MLSQDFINARKEELLKKKAELEEQLGSIVKIDRQSTEYDAKFPDFGDKEDENAAEVAAYQNNLSLEEDLKFSLSRIDKALHNMGNNTYGLCEKCNAEIQPGRLEAFPQATVCMDCKQKDI
ncbi:MAG: TraR/DksA family transcriptional regulator [Candidatus Komeilibacteria bacterium]